MTLYRMCNQTVDDAWPEWDELVEKAYLAKERPLCQCMAGGIQMYVAKVAGKHLVKRMPNSGASHAPGCESYEPPAELSGLGQLLGTAIEENVDDGVTALKFGFSLSKGANRSAPTASGEETDSVKTDGNRLTLRGTLHYLWEQAGFNRWSPGMEGKRSWYVVRKFLHRAAADKRAKGQDLGDILYIPEPYRVDDKDAIAQRRTVQFSKIAGAHKTGRRLNLVIGEVKEIGQSRYGYKVVLKHVPDASFMLNEDIHKRLVKRFNIELGLWDAAEDVHLILIGTYGVGITGIASLEELALMTVDLNWIPVESMFDKMLVSKLIELNRRFVKGLRYNLPSSRPLASAVLADTEPRATALYIVPPGAEDDYTNATQGLMQESDLQSWMWKAGEVEMPALPAAAPPPYVPPRRSSPPAARAPAGVSAPSTDAPASPAAENPMAASASSTGRTAANAGARSESNAVPPHGMPARSPAAVARSAPSDSSSAPAAQSAAMKAPTDPKES